MRPQCEHVDAARGRCKLAADHPVGPRYDFFTDYHGHIYEQASFVYTKPALTGPEHYHEAERLTAAARVWDRLGHADWSTEGAHPLDHPNGQPILDTEAATYAALAQVHATLALAATTGGECCWACSPSCPGGPPR
jgi:hypothetical protein